MNNRRLHIFVLIDALGWEYIKQEAFLLDLLTFRKPVETVLGYSSGAIPAILTGLPPDRNGHWNLLYYNPDGSPFRWLDHFAFLPDRWLNSRVSRKAIKEIGRRVLGLGSQFECCVSPLLLPRFDWTEKSSIYERGGITGAPSFFDHLARHSIPHRIYTYQHSADVEILDRARRDIKEEHADVFFLYLSELDAFLHLHCQDRALISDRLAWYEAGLRELFKVAQRVDNDLTFSVFSDHGMTPVREHYDVVERIESLSFAMPQDYLAVYDSTMARFWFFNEATRRNTLECLRSVHCGRILTDDDLLRMGVLFSDRRYGETIFLMDPGVLLAHSNFNGKSWKPKGMHGYHPDDPYSDAIYLSNRTPATPIKGVADIFNVLMEAAGQTCLIA